MTVAVADSMSVRTATELLQHKDVAVVGTDIDLLILLIQLASPDNCLVRLHAWEWNS